MLHLARDALRRFLDVPKFPTPEAEEAFWVRDDARKYEFRCYALLAGVIAYAGFAAVDVIIAGEVLEQILWIRAGSSCIAFLLWLLFLTPRSHREREAIIFAYGAVLVAANIWMSTIAVPPAADYLPFSLSLCLAFGVGLIVLRLRTVAALSILGCAAYWLSVPYSNTSTGALAVNAHFLTISVFAALVGSFARERLEREQALTEAQLENLRIRAEEANLAKDRLLASVSHELRTPVNALLGFSEMMRGEVFGPVSPPRYRDYIDDMHFSAGLLRNSIDDLLELSRLQMEKAAWKESEFLLEQVVATSVAICEGDARQAGITLRLEEPEDETLLTGDPQRLTQTIVNVITNAVKFSSEGGEVRVSAGRDGEDYRISVSDSGCGIPPEALDRIFEPFAQAHADCYSAGKGGLGLGLTIASRILARLDGRLAIESAVGVGTTVSIHLPGHRLRAMPCVAVPRARAG